MTDDPWTVLIYGITVGIFIGGITAIFVMAR